MDPPELQTQDAAAPDWLEEIVARLGEDPDECGPAIEGLAALDEEIRAQVLAELVEHGERPGVRDLLRRLGSAVGPAEPGRIATALPARRVVAAGGDLAGSARIVRSLVTAVDGDGRGTIVISAADGGSRRTAAFLCDVRGGLLDAVGEVEGEHPDAGWLVDEGMRHADGGHVLDAPDLAVRLLGGCLALGGSGVPDHVRAWLEATLGPSRFPVGSPATFPGPEPDPIPDRDLSGWAERILDACPGWLDRSKLTYELAEEIALREGDAAPDPIRDAGAYRYLFEHLLIDRLDLYARMLLWMGWVWLADGRPELARPAFALAAQLSDAQYAVPSHPFTVALTTRSLLAAQAARPGGDEPGGA